MVDEYVIGGQIGPEVWRLVRNWTPTEVHDHERKYQPELQDYLDEQLNGGGGPMDVGMGGGRSHAVSTERGTAYGDVVVDDTVGIELKRNFSNSQKRKLRGQLEDYGDSYGFVIACACGIEDTDGWREVKNELSGQRGTMDVTEFRFTTKRRENFGDDGGGGQSGGLLGGGGLL